MPGRLLHVGAVVQCFHQAPATIAASQTKVTIGGQPVATTDSNITVAGCPFQVPVGAGTKPQPCVSIDWTLTTSKVEVGGKKALLGPATGTGGGVCLSAEQIRQGAPTISQLQQPVSGS
jgi:uncharacterized Zn-binding protein involved in type VI secretion